MKNSNCSSLLRFRSHILLAVLVGIVIAIAYFASASHDKDYTPSSSAIREVTDYARNFESNTDDDTLFIVTLSLSLPQPPDWGNVLNTTILKHSFSRIYYRAQPRSPPFQLSI